VSPPQVTEVPTTQGPARLHLFAAHRRVPAQGLVVLGHGAGGGVDAPDLHAVAVALPGAGWSVILVEQPWHVAGRKVATAPARLDEAWLDAVAAIRVAHPRERLVLGGRSAGARVACRTAPTLRPSGLVLLSFPLRLRPGAASRSGELESAGSLGIPLVVVQGESDGFGRPEEVRAHGVDVRSVPGTHGFSAKTAPAVAQAVAHFLAETFAAR
jgi:predicted alpha/beta-hydrolase family hydrolase